jgi:hypothetical protein
MNLEQAARQALEALEVVPFMSNKDDYDYLNKTIATLRKALEQPTREWVGLTDMDIDTLLGQREAMSLLSLIRTLEARLKGKNT